MKILFGIGNPGEEYASTRHNVGFRVLDVVVREAPIPNRSWSHRGQSLLQQKTIDAEKVLLIKPLTYVNLCGRALKSLLRESGARLDDVLVICDDFHLPLGKLRFRTRGSAGGHNGLESIIEHLGTEEFKRLRLGIGSPGRRNPARFVLLPFRRAEEESVNEMLQTAASAACDWVMLGIEKCMARYNRSVDKGGST